MKEKKRKQEEENHGRQDLILSKPMMMMKKKKKKKKKKNEVFFLPGVIEALKGEVLKYWNQRYTLFSRFDDGIEIDEEGLFSVTPEEIARNQCLRCSGPAGHMLTIIDAFCGVAGNAIQFALRDNYVVAIDINPTRIECARRNAIVYGVDGQIDFIVGDFFQLAPSLKADVLFLSPPWGGPGYARSTVYDIETMLQPKNGFSLFRVALSIAPTIVLFLPRTTDTEQLEQLAWLSNPPLPYEVEKNFVNGRLKGVTVYYGNVACKTEYCKSLIN